MTLWLNQSDVEKCIHEQSINEAVKAAFKVLDENRTVPLRIRAELSSICDAPSGAEAMILVPGAINGIPAYTVKVHSKYPNNIINSLPAIQGLIHLFDSHTGSLIAIIDSPLLTSHRTAATGAVAADALARKNATSVAIIGAGAQGEMQFRYLKFVRTITDIYVFDVCDLASSQYAERRRKEGFKCHVMSSLEDAIKQADIVVSATWSMEPFIFQDMVRNGTHITTLGPDSPGKVEVAEEVIRHSKFVCDHKGMAISIGALNTFQNTSFSFTSLTEVLQGRESGRSTDDEITVFGGVGLPFQDLVAVWDIYHRAQELGIGQRLK